MEHYRKIIVLFIVLFFPKLIFSQSYPDTAVNSLMRSGIKEIANQNYTEASNDFLKLNKKYPGIPLGKIYIAATEIAKAYDLGEESNSDFINNNLNKAEEQSKKLLETDETNVWYNYFVALCNGFKAYFDAINKNWFAAFSEGLSAKSDFEKCLKIDSNFYDAYIAIGAYDYWKSRKTEFLNWLPFMSDKEQVGINLINIAIKHSSYNNYSAISSLIWIYVDQRDYIKAKKTAEEGLKLFPDNRAFKWGLARAYENIDKTIAIKYYQEVLQSYLKVPNQNHYNEIILKHIIAQIYQRIGDKSKALLLCNDILSIKNLSEKVKENLSDRLKRVEAMKEELTR